MIVHRTFYCYDDSNNYENEDEEWEWYSDEDEEENIEENDIQVDEGTGYTLVKFFALLLIFSKKQKKIFFWLYCKKTNKK